MPLWRPWRFSPYSFLVSSGFAAAGFRAEDFRAAARLGAARLGAARLAFLAVALRAGFLALTDLPRRAAPARRAAVLAPALRLVAERFPAFFLVLVVFDFDLRAALAITSSCFVGQASSRGARHAESSPPIPQLTPG